MSYLGQISNQLSYLLSPMVTCMMASLAQIASGVATGGGSDFANLVAQSDPAEASLVWFGWIVGIVVSLRGRRSSICDTTTTCALLATDREKGQSPACSKPNRPSSRLCIAQCRHQRKLPAKPN